MSVWEDDFTDPLLASPWLPLSTSPSSLVKYAPHRHRPGYIILLTNLTGVYVESLLAPSIPGRLNEIKRTYKRRSHRGEDEDDGDDVIAQSEAALARLGELFESADEVGECEMELKDHDYHDKVLAAHADGWDWLFNLTELKGRDPIQILGHQLISPLAHALAEAQGVDLPKGTKKKPPSAMEVVSAALEDEGIRDLLWPNATGGKRKPGGAGGRKKPERKTVEEEDDAVEEDEDQGAEAAGEEGEAEEEGEEEYRSSPEPSPSPPPKATPKSRSKRQSPSPEDEEDPPAAASASASTSPPPTRSHTKSKCPPIPSDSSNPSDNAFSSGAPTRSASPAKPSASQKKKAKEMDEANLAPPTQGSQKTKRQREEEEEEELDRKLSEMKRKMGSGGGGRLGKRRMAR